MQRIRLLSEFAAARRSGEFAIGENAVSTQVGSLHLAAKCFTQVGRDTMPIVKMLGTRDEFRFRFKHDEVGVESLGKVAFA